MDVARDGIVAGETDGAGVVRRLGTDDFDIWYPLFHALEVQENVHIHGSREEVRGRFERAPWRWWGAFDGRELAAVACLDLAVAGTGHIGGIYVRPAHRRKGFARLAIAAIVREGQTNGGLSRLILFSREDNVSAQRLYEGMGFAPVGHFGFLLGSWA
jgi:ribosomal protein S18 acetylase RimI-like enzyme